MCPSPGFGIFQDVVVSRIWLSSAFGPCNDGRQDLAFSRICQLPGLGILQDVAFSRMWQSPGLGSPQDVAASRIRHSPGYDIHEDLPVSTM